MTDAFGGLPEAVALNTILDYVHDAVYVASTDGRVLQANRRARAIAGCTDTEMRGRQISEFVVTDGNRLLEPSTLAHTPGTGETVNAKGTLLSHTGDRTPVEITISRDEFPEHRIAIVICAREIGHDASASGTSEDLPAFFDNNPSPVMRVGPSGQILYANSASWILLEHWGIGIGDVLPREWGERIRGVIERGESVEMEVTIGFKVVHLVGVPIPEMGYVSLYGLDVTDRKRIEEKLALSAQVVENASEGVMITDQDFRVLDINRAFSEITGYSPGDILGESAIPLLSGRQGEDAFRRIWGDVKNSGSWQGELWDRRKNGEVYPKWLSISAVKDDLNSAINYTIVFADISKVKEAEEHLYRLAHFDSLTGLANRRYFRDRLDSAIAQSKRARRVLGLMFVDLDSFKMVNDNLGHSAGDQLLQTAAQRLRESVRESDTVSRIGGDEFTVILPDLHSAREVAPIAEKVLAKIGEPMTIEGQELTVSASIGVAVYPDDGENADTLLQYADTAMYRIKQGGKNNYQYFSPDMNTRAAERLSMRTRLKRAIEHRELEVYYQPQVDATTGEIVGLEALARWQTEDLGMISPGEFIPLAEESGLIYDLGNVIFEAVCKQWLAWNRKRIAPTRICVNVSALQLRAPEFPRRLEEIAQALGVPAAAIEFEITESMFIEESEMALRKLRELRDSGATLAMDDFGTKYSSLGYLRRLPIDRIKIDRSFIQDIPGDANSSEIASAVIAMGRSMHLEVIGEGIETVAQLEYLRDQGCDLIQGNLVSAAVPPRRLERALRAGKYALESNA